MKEEKDFFSMFLLTVKKKTFRFREYIYKQYDPPSNFYIIAEGKLFIELNSMGLKPLGRGDYFGLESIIYDSDQG
jgi:CRP-like cAMP-binding protein